MPVYDYQCQNCNSVTTRFRKVDDRNLPLQCECDGNMRVAILSAPAAKVQPEAHYVCPATGEKITSWSQRRNSFAKHGLQEVDPDQHKEGMTKSMQKAKERKELAKNYLPKDLKKQIKHIGQNSDNPFHSG